MSLSVICPDCEKKLKVPVSAAGKKIRCPACKASVAVPEIKQVVAVDEEEEETYGTKERDDEDEDDERPRRRKKKRRRDDDDDDEYGGKRRRRKEPHRGGKILTYGMLSILISCVPIISWYLAVNAIMMANEDFSEMNSGSMDRSGRGMTQAGNICAYIGAVLALVVLVLGIIGKVMKYF